MKFKVAGSQRVASKKEIGEHDDNSRAFVKSENARDNKSKPALPPEHGTAAVPLVAVKVINERNTVEIVFEIRDDIG